MKELLKELCSKDGISGNEKEVRDYIISLVEPYSDELTVDTVGNLIVFKKGERTGAKKLMVCGHMDEVGFRVLKVCEDGKIKFALSGDIEKAAILGSRLRGGPKKTKAVVYFPQSMEYNGGKLPIGAMFIDMGASSKTEAETAVSPGDCFVYDSEFMQLANDKVKGKAIENRLGCAVMINMIKAGVKYDTWFVFSSCSEMSGIEAAGGRGALVAAASIEPDVCMVVNTRGIADLPDVPERKQIAKQGSGAVIAFADRGAIYDRGLRERIINAANIEGIKWQNCSVIDGVTDAKNIQTVVGSLMFSVSAPVRYIRTGNTLLDINDAEEVYKIAQLFVEEAGDYNA